MNQLNPNAIALILFLTALGALVGALTSALLVCTLVGLLVGLGLVIAATVIPRI